MAIGDAVTIESTARSITTMVDKDIFRNLPDGRGELAYDAFLAVTPAWPEWLRVNGCDVRAGPVSRVRPTRRAGTRDTS
jgi:hypothetical protein